MADDRRRSDTLPAPRTARGSVTDFPEAGEPGEEPTNPAYLGPLLDEQARAERSKRVTQPLPLPRPPAR